MNRISFLNRGYAFKGLLAVLVVQSIKRDIKQIFRHVIRTKETE